MIIIQNLHHPIRAQPQFPDQLVNPGSEPFGPVAQKHDPFGLFEGQGPQGGLINSPLKQRGGIDPVFVPYWQV